MLSKTNWFKGKAVVEPPLSNQKGKFYDAPGSSKDENNANTNQQGGNYDASSNHQGSVQGDDGYDNPSNSQGSSSLQGEDSKLRNNKKKRGAGRDKITLGGLKKVEVATKRTARQKLKKKLGRLGLPSKMNNSLKKKGTPPPTVSVCFIDNSANGVLVKRMQGVEDEVSSKVNYRVEIEVKDDFLLKNEVLPCKNVTLVYKGKNLKIQRKISIEFVLATASYLTQVSI